MLSVALPISIGIPVHTYLDFPLVTTVTSPSDRFGRVGNASSGCSHLAEMSQDCSQDIAMYIQVILSRLTLRMNDGTDRRETEILNLTNCADPIFRGKLPGTSVAGYGRKRLL